jgi:Tfp pilus assembly protein PilO
MKCELRFRPGDDVRAIWLLAVAVLVCGSVSVQMRYQAAIRSARDRTEALYHRTLADMRLVHEAGDLREIQSRAERDLARISQDQSLSATTADLLDTLHGSARAFDSTVLALQPSPSQAATPGNALQATPITMRVRGRFRNILRLVEDLSHHATLISVTDTEMSLANDASANDAEPRLDATIHATLYRLTVPAMKELRVATAG